MTLVIGAVWQGRAIHASDRFISVPPQPAYPTGEFDPHSNKTVVVCGSDCRVAIGYSGLAFLHGKPTDEFITQGLTGILDLSGGGALMGWSDRGLHYREIRDRIQHAIADAYTRLPNDGRSTIPTYVLGAGFQRKMRFPKNLHPKGTWQRKPVMFWIAVNQYGSVAVELMTQPAKEARQIGHEIEFWMSSVGTYEPTLRAQTEQRLKSYTSLPTATAEGVMEILLDEIQDTALVHPQVVGLDAMGVIVDGPGNFVLSHFRLGEEAKHAELRQRAIAAMGPGATGLPSHVTGVPTPIVITPTHAIYLPSLSTPEPWTEYPGGFEFRITGWPSREVQSGERAASLFTGQPRKGPDGKWQAWSPPSN